MRSFRPTLVIVCAGLLTFGVVFALLQLTRSEAVPAQAVTVVTAALPPTQVQPVPRATDSLAGLLAVGHVAVGVPSTGSEPLLQNVEPGDRLDVTAVLPSPDDTRPVTAVVVSGATVLRPSTASDPLLLDVSSQDALVLAHLVLGDTRLTFVVWSKAGGPASEQTMDERTARSVLGLPTFAMSTLLPTATPALAPAPAPAPTPAPPTPTAAPAPIAATYTVQAGESMDSVAARLDVDPGALWWTNRTELDPLAPLVAGTRLRLPLVAGFLHEIQPGDSWDSLATIFGVSSSTLRQRNDMPDNGSLPAVGLVFIPRRT
jgi:LysM repeat protein